jgi:hypothetical protein
MLFDIKEQQVLGRTNHLLSFDTWTAKDRFCGLVVRVLGHRSGGPGSIPGTTRKKKE